MLNIEKVVIDYLKNNGYKAYAQVPKNRPSEFLLVERTGGGSLNVAMDKPAVAVQCWSSSRYKASELAYKVNECMFRMRDLKDICSVKNENMYNFPAEDSERYQVTYTITHYK